MRRNTTFLALSLSHSLALPHPALPSAHNQSQHVIISLCPSRMARHTSPVTCTQGGVHAHTHTYSLALPLSHLAPPSAHDQSQHVIISLCPSRMAREEAPLFFCSTFKLFHTGLQFAHVNESFAVLLPSPNVFCTSTWCVGMAVCGVEWDIGSGLAARSDE